MEDEEFLAAVEADNAIAPAEEPKTEPETPAAEEAPKSEVEAPAPAEPAPTEPATPTEPPVVQPEPKHPDPGFVPITALLDTRDKLKAAEAALAQYQAQQQAQPSTQAPDPIEDPEGYAEFQDARIQQVLLNQTLNTSERFARKEHGAETVDAAKTWATQRFAQDPLYQAQVLRDPDPYERVVADYRREQLFSKVSDPSEFDAFLAWKAAQATITAAPTGAAPPPPSPAIPPRSLASAPSAGNVLTDVAQTDEEVFEETFARK